MLRQKSVKEGSSQQKGGAYDCINGVSALPRNQVTGLICQSRPTNQPQFTIQ